MLRVCLHFKPKKQIQLKHSQISSKILIMKTPIFFLLNPIKNNINTLWYFFI